MKSILITCCQLLDTELSVAKWAFSATSAKAAFALWRKFAIWNSDCSEVLEDAFVVWLIVLCLWGSVILNVNLVNTNLMSMCGTHSNKALYHCSSDLSQMNRVANFRCRETEKLSKNNQFFDSFYFESFKKTFYLKRNTSHFGTKLKQNCSDLL